MYDYISIWAVFGSYFYDLLPNSPFAQFNTYISDVITPYLKWLNWFFPVDWCITLLGVWLGAISVYYVIQGVGRWLKILG